MKPLHISVIELDYHPEVLRDFCRIMADTNTIVTVFCTELIWKKVQTKDFTLASNIEVHLKRKSDSVKKFILSHFELINSSDIILFDTLASNFIFFSKITFKPAVVVRIHNSNANFNKLSKAYKPKFTPFFIWKDFSHFIRKELGEFDWHFRKKFLQKANYYAFSSQFIADYAVQHYGLEKNKCLNLPISFAPDVFNNSSVKKSDTTHIVVIGKIDRRNRDYDILLKGFKQVVKKTKKPIQLVLLGASDSAYGRAVVKAFKSLESDNFSLVHYESFVEQSEFSTHIQQAAFIIIPVRIDTRFTIYSEKYGYTKISGSINDLTKFQKPALIFSGYPVDDNLKAITASFSDEDELADRIVNWSESEKYKQVNIEDALKKYQLESVRKLYLKTFNNMRSTRK